MSVYRTEKNHSLRSVTALALAGGLFSTLLGLGNLLGAKGDEQALADKQTYTSRHLAELTLYQSQLDAQTPSTYRSGGKRLVPKAAFQAHYPQLQESASAIEHSQAHHERNSHRFNTIGGTLLALAAGVGWAGRQRRRNQEQALRTAAALTAPTAMLTYVRPLAAEDVAKLPLAAPEPRLYGTPYRPTLTERRAAQRAAEPCYEPFATALNHEACALEISTAVHITT